MSLPQPPQPARVAARARRGTAAARCRFPTRAMIESASRIRPQRLRTDDRSANDVAEGRAEPELAEYGDEQQRRAEHERAVDQQGAGGDLGRGFAASRSSRSLLIAASNARNGRRMAPWRELRDRAGASAARPGQLAGIVARAGKPARRARQRTGDLVRPTVLARLPRAGWREAWPKAQACTFCEIATTRPSSSQLDLEPDRASACRANVAPTSRRRAPAARGSGARPPAAGSRSCRAARSFPAPRSA